MKLCGCLLSIACCLGFAVQGVALPSPQVYSEDTPPAKQPPTSKQPPTQKVPGRTQEPGGTTHGHGPDTKPGRTAGDSGHGAEIAGIAVGVAATVGIIEWIHHQHEIANKVKANGPQVPKAFDMNDLHITGFMQDNWPIAIEYSLPGKVDAECVITAGNKKKMSFSLPATHSVRRIVIAQIPAGFSKKPQLADYWVHLDASPPPVNSFGWPGLRIYAVAAGPRAVGSVAIDQVSFAPTDKPVHLSTRESALFGFHSHGDFDSVTAEFQLVAPHQGRNFVTTEESIGVKPVSENERVQGLAWQPQKARSGDHIVRIVAWRGINRGADWVSAFSADMVSIEK